MVRRKNDKDWGEGERDQSQKTRASHLPASSLKYLTKQSVGMDPLHAVHDTLKYLVITSSAVPSEAFWLTRVFYTRRHRHLNHSSIHSSIHSTTHQFQLSPLYQLLVGLAISQGGGTIIDVLCNRKVTWIANDFLYMMALGCWAAVYFTLFNTLYESKIFQAIAVAGETISWARSLLGGIDIAIKEYPGSTVAIYFFSMLAGAGGGLIGQAEMRIWASSPSELKLLAYSPTGVHLSLCMGILYVVLSRAMELPVESIKVVICGLLLTLSYLSYFGVSVDPLAALMPSGGGGLKTDQPKKNNKPKHQ